MLKIITAVRMKNTVYLGLLLLGLLANAQKSKLTPEHYQQIRKEFREKLPDNSIAVLFSAPIRNRANDVDYHYHQDPHFFYLTGWHQPHSVLMIYKNNQRDNNGYYSEKIYVLERNPYKEMWNGRRYSLSQVKELGFERVAERAEFKNDLEQVNPVEQVLFFEFKNDIRDQTDDPNDLFDLKAAFREAINFPNDFNPNRHAAYQKIIASDETSADQVKSALERIVARDSTLANDDIINGFLENPNQDYYVEAKRKSAFALREYNFDIETLPRIMADMREVKTPEEIVLLKKAVAISVVGQVEVMKAMHPIMGEREIQGIHEFVYRKYGAADEGYPSIVGAGENGCILHYIENDKETTDNQLVLMDLGAEFYGYTADVTRTIPANGVFSPKQKALYQIVYDAQEAAIQAAKVGVSFRDLYLLSYDIVAQGLMQLGIIDEASKAKRYYPHGLSHHIGLDVHDPGNYGKLEPNMVITIEPGIYIPENSPCDPKWWNIGIRIEDDIMITEKGGVNLSAGAPREWQAIEELMKEESVLKDFVLPDIESLVQ